MPSLKNKIVIHFFNSNTTTAPNLPKNGRNWNTRRSIFSNQLLTAATILLWGKKIKRPSVKIDKKPKEVSLDRGKTFSINFKSDFVSALSAGLLLLGVIFLQSWRKMFWFIGSIKIAFPSVFKTLSIFFNVISSSVWWRIALPTIRSKKLSS